ncbi:MAG: PSD1 and planctomycete cytochrome C domain-containing protein [Verrucomicrobiales bacterium]|nr:PSD1 and planctomycete cytochrome C domain-containing protein [Verrucomicrobiales bacterium]
MELQVRASFLGFRVLVVSGLLGLWVGVSAGDEGGDDTVSFSRDVLPVLSNKCFVCHGPDTKKETDLRLDSYGAATEDRDGVRSINPDDLEKSELLFRIHDGDDPMPPEDAEKQLTEGEREILSKWVRQGGNYAKHWAFERPVKRVVDGGGAAGVIDGWVEAGLAGEATGFAPEAEREVLARRSALVLTGLPPEAEVLEAYLESGDYAALVETLMASERYGENQARYWLDAVRYGDTHGLHLDNKRGIYPYRDWVVKALNDNLPLDTFLTWQLAGDLLPEPTLEQRVATGFVRMNPTTAEGGAIPAEFQAKNNFDRVEMLGTVAMGVTMNCARCHTHKYDPIPQTEYYRLMAFFNSTAESSMDGNKYEYGPVAKAPVDMAGWRAWEALQAEKASGADVTAKQAELEKGFTTTLVAKDLDKPRVTKVRLRGEYSEPDGEALEPGILEVMGAFPEEAPRNRLGLAQWLTSREHPLVARVLVNRMWQSVFGDGLVRTPEDFGLQGQQPTHPELLDWLAVELQDSGWDMKHVLRLMVTSRTFKQDSARRDEVDDEANLLFARGPRYRLDAEVLRDVALWASGLLDPHMGGEGVKPYQPSGMWKALAHPGSNTKQYQQDKGKQIYRRSLYVYWKRTSPHPMMTLFDAPSRETSCVRRSRSNTPLQSLGLFNETQRAEMARALGERLMKAAEGDGARLGLLFELLASRGPNAVERDACLGLLGSMRERYAGAEEDAVALVSVGDAGRDESLDAVEHAAWTQVAATVLSSDVAILLY